MIEVIAPPALATISTVKPVPLPPVVVIIFSPVVYPVFVPVIDPNPVTTLDVELAYTFVVNVLLINLVDDEVISVLAV